MSKRNQLLQKIDFTGVSENDKDEILKVVSVKRGEVYDQEKAELTT